MPFFMDYGYTRKCTKMEKLKVFRCVRVNPKEWESFENLIDMFRQISNVSQDLWENLSFRFFKMSFIF